MVAIHIGVPWTGEMVAMAWKHETVFIGVDAYAPKHRPAELVHNLNTYGRDKVLFGSDRPVIDPERTIQEIDAMEIRPETRRLPMRDNALKIFKLPGASWPVLD